MTVEDDVQQAAESGNIITGTEETVKFIDECERVVIAGNTPAHIEEKVRDAADDADVDCELIDADNVELGALCMKPYATAVVGIKG